MDAVEVAAAGGRGGDGGHDGAPDAGRDGRRRAARAVVLHGLAGDLHERLLERRALRGQLDQRDRLAGGGQPDLRAVEAGDDRACRRRAARRPRRRASSRPGESRGIRRADEHRVARRRPHQLGDRSGRDQPAAADDDELLGGQRHLAHQVRGHEHGPALGGELPQQRADPDDALGVEPVDRFVEQQRRRDRPAARRRCRAVGPCPARTRRPACGRPGRGRRGPGPRRRGTSGCGAWPPWRAGGCGPSGRCARRAPRAGRRPRAAGPGSRCSAGRRSSPCPRRVGRGRAAGASSSTCPRRSGPGSR